MADREVTIKISAKNLTEAEFKKVRRGLGDLGSSAKGATQKTSGLQRAFSSFGKAAPGALKIVTAAAAASTCAILGIAAGVVKLGQKGAVISDVKSAFDSLSTSAGSTGAVMLGELQRGVKGTVINFELMKMANKALGAGLLDSAGDARTMAEGARLLAKRTGGDTAQAFETLTTAMASGRTAQLKMLGLFVDNKKAVEDYAKAQGKSVSSLTDADRAAALQVATLAALRSELASNAPPLADFGELIEQGKVAVTNLVDGLAVMISKSPPLIAGMQAVRDVFSKAFGGEQSGLILTIVNMIERAAFIALEFGKAGISAAGFIYRAFSGIKLVCLGIAIGMTEVQKTILNVVASALEAASRIPGLGEAFKGAAGLARAAADGLGSVNTGLKEQVRDTLAATAGVDSFGQGLNTAKGIIDGVQTSMVNAGTSQRELNSATEAGTTAIGNFGTANTTAGESIKQSCKEWGEKFLQNLKDTKTETEQWSKDEQQFYKDLAGPQGVGALKTAIVGVGDVTAVKTAEMTAAFAEFGIKTRAEQELTVKKLEAAFGKIKESGLATAKALLEAEKKLQKARQEAADENKEYQMTSNEAILEGSKQILQALGTKYKAAAVAAAVIATYQAVARSLGAAPWPGNLILAAGALASGIANVMAIKSKDAYRAGTLDLDYQNFGRESPAILHGAEAVIPRGGGHELAGEVAAALSRIKPYDPEAAEQRALLQSIDGRLAGLPRAVARATRDAILLAS